MKRVGNAMIWAALVVLVPALIALPILLAVVGLGLIFDWAPVTQPDDGRAGSVMAGVALLWMTWLSIGLVLVTTGDDR